MKRTHIFLISLSFLISFSAFSQVNIIPKPNELTLSSKGESFKITPQTKLIIKDKSLTSTATFLNSYLKEVYGFELATATFGIGTNLIVLQFDKNAPKTNGSTLVPDPPSPLQENCTSQQLSLIGYSLQLIARTANGDFVLHP